MILNTSCAHCRQTLTLAAVSRQPPTHPHCPPQPTHLDQLESTFIEAVLAENASEADALAHTLDRSAQADTGDLRASAVRLAALGWPVFPLKPHGKLPAIPRDRGGHGFKDATTDTERVDRYWSHNPTANIGVPTGHRFDVIDVDYKVPGAALKWADIQDTDIVIDALVSTPHGLHAYIEPTGEGNSVRFNKAIGIDYRGLGGYVVVPPSRLTDGAYRWWSIPSPRLLE